MDSVCGRTRRSLQIVLHVEVTGDRDRFWLCKASYRIQAVTRRFHVFHGSLGNFRHRAYGRNIDEWKEQKSIKRRLVTQILGKTREFHSW